MKCNCDDWKNSIPQIDGAQILACNHGMFYSGAIFNFCPWCGQKLEHDQGNIVPEVDEKALGWRESEKA